MIQQIIILNLLLQIVNGCGDDSSDKNISIPNKQILSFNNLIYENYKKITQEETSKENIKIDSNNLNQLWLLLADSEAITLSGVQLETFINLFDKDGDKTLNLSEIMKFFISGAGFKDDDKFKTHYTSEVLGKDYVFKNILEPNNDIYSVESDDKLYTVFEGQILEIKKGQILFISGKTNFYNLGTINNYGVIIVDTEDGFDFVNEYIINNFGYIICKYNSTIKNNKVDSQIFNICYGNILYNIDYSNSKITTNVYKIDCEI